MLGWCTDRGLPLGFRRPRTVDCGTHGWMEYVPAASCSERAEVGSFYRRAGSLLCLLWVLGATDIHLGNIIASGEHPVPIDLETLLQPRLPEMESVTHGSGAQVCALQRLRASALQTGLLPRWHLRDEHTSHDLTGLGGGEPQDLPGLRRVWHDVNRDTMSTSAQPLHSPPGSSLPRLDGIDQPLAGKNPRSSNHGRGHTWTREWKRPGRRWVRRGPRPGRPFPTEGRRSRTPRPASPAEIPIQRGGLSSLRASSEAR